MKTSALLTLAMNHVVNHPEEWDQSTWYCGTKACLAGRIVLIAGGSLGHVDDENGVRPAAVFDGAVYDIPILAGRLAHLYEWEAGWLWDPERTMPELLPVVNRLERGQAPHFWVPRRGRGNGGTWWDENGRLRIAVHRATLYNDCYAPAHYSNHPGQEEALHIARSLAARYGPFTYRPPTEKGHDRWLHAPQAGRNSTP